LFDADAGSHVKKPPIEGVPADRRCIFRRSSRVEAMTIVLAVRADGLFVDDGTLAFVNFGVTTRLGQLGEGALSVPGEPERGLSERSLLALPRRAGSVQPLRPLTGRVGALWRVISRAALFGGSCSAVVDLPATWLITVGQS